jgi:hypothetical protein
MVLEEGPMAPGEQVDASGAPHTIEGRVYTHKVAGMPIDAVIRSGAGCSIAQRYGSGAGALGPANSVDPWRNFAGQCLTIPGLDPRPAAPAAGLAL